MQKLRLVGVLGVIAYVCSCGRPVDQKPVRAEVALFPTAKKVPVVDSYHGREIVDEYQWLENWEDDEVKNWSRAQNAAARGYLNGIGVRAKLKEQVAAIFNQVPASYSALTSSAGKLFALKLAPPANQPMLVLMGSLHEPSRERIVFDPNAIDDGGTTHIDWYRPSPDGSLVALALSKDGTEDGDVYIFDVATGVKKSEVIELVTRATAFGDLAWARDGKGFYYTRYPRKGERPDEDLLFYQTVWFHALGSKVEDDKMVLGEGLPRVAAVELDASPFSDSILITVQNGDSREREHHVLQSDGTWKKLSGFDDKIVIVAFGPDGEFYAVSQGGAPRGKVMKLRNLEDSMEEAELLIPEGDASIVVPYYDLRSFVVSKSRIYITYQLGGPSEVRVFHLDGTPAAAPDIPPVSAVGSSIAPFEDEDLLFRRNSFLSPPAWYHYSAASGETTTTNLVSDYNIDFSDATVTRDFATSKDGTKIPINIIHKKDVKLDGDNPVLVTGYGAYGDSRPPRFDPLLRIWLDFGGVMVRTNLRGGGEYGEEWHQQGSLLNKQNTFDDLLASVEYMYDRGFTKPSRLAITGRSAGGLLMGAALTQHPGSFAATVSVVGMYDMLRAEQDPNGIFNIPEFGTVAINEQFEALRAYSPYHNVEDGTAYPAVLLIHGENDNRVSPHHSRKMVARLQAATSSNNPILLCTSATTGHGLDASLDARVEQKADELAFLFHVLKVEDK